MTHESLARRLRVLRAERGITLAEAEELTGVTRETLGALEHGQRGAYTSTLQKIADGYGTTVSALLEEEPAVPLVETSDAELTLQEMAASAFSEALREGATVQFEDAVEFDQAMKEILRSGVGKGRRLVVTVLDEGPLQVRLEEASSDESTQRVVRVGKRAAARRR